MLPLAQLLIAVAAIVVFQSACGLLATLNLRLLPHDLLFPVPLIAVALYCVWRCRWKGGDGKPISLNVAATAVAFVVVLSSLGLWLTLQESPTLGQAGLRGDSLEASLIFRIAYSLSMVFSDGLIEEAAIRGLLQARIAEELGAHKSQFLSTALLIGLHIFSKSTAPEWIFVIVTALSTGYLATRFTSVYLPAAVHGTSNAVIAATVLFLR
jgi:membrane protease YdiL (CAAX protease family)